ncbi:MAG: ATP-binding domain-containing protein [Tepidisphaeraceae bacterium]
MPNIKEVQHGLLVTTALEAFGDSPAATLFIEIRSTAGNVPRPDLILLHPHVGVLVIENKGVSLTDIHGVEGTSLHLIRDGRLKHEDPFHQAERVMFRLKDLIGPRAELSDVLFLHTAALPRISRHAFDSRFDIKWPDETLFAEECQDAKRFRSHIVGFSDHTLRRVTRKTKLTPRAAEAAMTILSGRGFVYAPRRMYIEETDERLIGVQVQQMELALKEATAQQKELGRADLRGTHRLFRGVAGSGKSIMLALSVAHTLTKYREERHDDLFGGGGGRKSRVLVACFNKTLVHYLRQRIDDRFGRLAWDKPADDELVVRHFEGLVRLLGEQAPSLRTNLTFRQKEQRAKALCDLIDKLPDAARENVLFDAVYADEAQDLLPVEFELLMRLARKDAKGNQTLVLFYDNAQNIYGVPTPVWSKIGINIVGRTVFLDQCLRNTNQTLLFAFNVLVGTFAAEGVRVQTRQFADVESLRQRDLIEEKEGRFEIKFAPRTGPLPFVRAYESRAAEIDGTVEAVRRLVANHKVVLSDILILYNSHHEYAEALRPKLTAILGGDGRVRFVDSAHNEKKNYPLIEDGVLTVSTIASAKGYDAPIVFMLGVDHLRADRTEDRALFYVGTTRAKLHLVASGVRQPTLTLLDEAEKAAGVLSGKANAPVEAKASPLPPPLPRRQAASAVSPPPQTPATPDRMKPQKICKHCGSARLHAQYGKFGYFFRCVDCTQNTAIDLTCPVCGKRGKVRKAGNDFFRECEACKHSELHHANVPLGSLFE